MAEIAAPPAKKRKTQGHEHISTSAPLYHPPQQHPVSELYLPTLVTVIVWDKKSDRKGKHKEYFSIPRALLSARSAYFTRVFNGSFKEATTGVLEISNARPWAFRTFVGWLYYQTIYHDPEQKPRTQFEAHDACGKQDSGISENETGISKAKGNIQVTATHDFPEPAIPQPRSRSNSLSAPNTTMTQGEEVPDNAPDEDEHHNPVTWPWFHLFSLYVFADQYDTRCLRMATLDIIQLKMLQAKPRYYFLPCTEDVRWVCSRLPSTSPLRRLLVDVWALWMTLGSNIGSTALEQEGDFATLPADFLAACSIRQKRHAHAVECPRCGQDAEGSAAECDARDTKIHTAEDALDFEDRHPCSYHEHGENDEEKAQCCLRWESLSHRLRIEL